jgi:hypothetical protein
LTIAITPAASLLTDFDQLDIAEAIRNAVAHDATILTAHDRRALTLLTYVPGLHGGTRALAHVLAEDRVALPLPTDLAMALLDVIDDDLLGSEPEWDVQEAWLAARKPVDTAGDPDEASKATPFDPSTLTLTAAHVHALAQPEGDVLAWDHRSGEVRAMTREKAITSGFVAFTNRGWLNDWTREPGCWNGDGADVTPECAEQLAGVLTEWLRRIA